MLECPEQVKSYVIMNCFYPDLCMIGTCTVPPARYCSPSSATPRPKCQSPALQTHPLLHTVELLTGSELCNFQPCSHQVVSSSVTLKAAVTFVGMCFKSPNQLKLIPFKVILPKHKLHHLMYVD